MLSIRDSRGRRLRTSYGSDRVSLRVAHGIEGGGPLLSGERSIDKKGAPKPTPEELAECRAVYRSLYSDARAFFRERLGKPLFLAYGTLLGCYRQGGYIEGDDDFDVCYVAEATDPEGVKAETLDMIESLAAAGFGVSFNRMGRLFRLYPRGAGASGAHLDVHSFWLERGKTWAHNDFCAPMGLDRFLPARVAPFDGAEVDLFADPEAFLAAHYGPGWKKPDPGFVNSYSGKDPRVLAHLGRALISNAEFLAVSERLAAMRAENPGTGAFVSIGARDLYPLPGRDEDLE